MVLENNQLKHDIETILGQIEQPPGAENDPALELDPEQRQYGIAESEKHHEAAFEEIDILHRATESVLDGIRKYKKTENILALMLDLRQTPKFLENNDPEIIRINGNADLWNHLQNLQAYVKSCVSNEMKNLKTIFEEQCKKVDAYEEIDKPAKEHVGENIVQDETQFEAEDVKTNENLTSIVLEQILEIGNLEMCQEIFREEMNINDAEQECTANIKTEEPAEMSQDLQEEVEMLKSSWDTLEETMRYLTTIIESATSELRETEQKFSNKVRTLRRKIISETESAESMSFSHVKDLKSEILKIQRQLFIEISFLQRTLESVYLSEEDGRHEIDVLGDTDRNETEGYEGQDEMTIGSENQHYVEAMANYSDDDETDEVGFRGWPVQEELKELDTLEIQLENGCIKEMKCDTSTCCNLSKRGYMKNEKSQNQESEPKRIEVDVRNTVNRIQTVKSENPQPASSKSNISTPVRIVPYKLYLPPIKKLNECPLRGCYEEFPVYRDLRQHIEDVHGGKVDCPYDNCTSKYNLKSLNRHVESFHRKSLVVSTTTFLPKYVHKVKGKEIYRKRKYFVGAKNYVLKRRKRKNPGGRFFCDFEGCDASFVDKRGQLKHREHVHNNVRVKCVEPNCPSIVKKVYLNEHIRRVHYDKFHRYNGRF